MSDRRGQYLFTFSVSIEASQCNYTRCNQALLIISISKCVLSVQLCIPLHVLSAMVKRHHNSIKY